MVHDPWGSEPDIGGKGSDDAWGTDEVSTEVKVVVPPVEVIPKVVLPDDSVEVIPEVVLPDDFRGDISCEEKGKGSTEGKGSTGSDKVTGKRVFEGTEGPDGAEDRRMVLFEEANPLKKYKRRSQDSGDSGSGIPLCSNIFPFDQLSDNEIVDYLENIGINFLTTSAKKEALVRDIRKLDFLQFYNTIEGVMSVIFYQYKNLQNPVSTSGGSLCV